jgi:hypothetical protein
MLLSCSRSQETAPMPITHIKLRAVKHFMSTKHFTANRATSKDLGSRGLHALSVEDKKRITRQHKRTFDQEAGTSGTETQDLCLERAPCRVGQASARPRA